MILVVGSFCILWGLVFGSFLNVCIYRIPRGESIVFPPSHCPQCQRRLGAWELIPVVSFLLQRGRCKGCDAPISWRYPLVETLTALLFVFVVWRWGLSWQSLFYCGLTALFILISFIDLDTLTIPTELIWAGVLWALAYNLLTRQPPFSWLGGGALGFGFFYMVYHLSNGGLGGGDVRLAGLLGLALGLKLMFFAFFVASMAGGLVAVFLLASRRADRKTAVPFGPLLAGGGYVAILFGEAFLHWYGSFFLGVF